MDRYHVLDVIAGVMLIAGGMNWLLVGLFSYNLIASLFVVPALVSLLYILVGIAGIYMIVRMPSLYHIGGRTHATPPRYTRTHTSST